MIKVTKLNGEEIILNTNLIHSIQLIPESKIILLEKEFVIVKETADEIIDKIIEFNAKIYKLHKTYTVEKINVD